MTLKIHNPYPFRAEQLETFLYWIHERHQIYLLKEKGNRRPWSVDAVMNTVYFTNPYRENDKVTKWFRVNMREPLRDDPIVAFTTIAFRRFNCIRTGEVLLAHHSHVAWKQTKAYEAIKAATQDIGFPYLSAAYMMTGKKDREKLLFFCELLTAIYEDRKALTRKLENCDTLEEGHTILQALPYQGPFLAYELITDLRHTYLFDQAPDIDTWCSFGPGSKRGINRLMYGSPATTFINNSKEYTLALLQELLTVVRDRFPKMPHFEMCEIEHSLCEFDKYQRVAEGGRPKRWYPHHPKKQKTSAKQ